MSRLLILSCSATKATAPGFLPARQRYQGPLWQTLRAADPAQQLATVFALSARYGLVGADELLPDYNQLMTAERAAQLGGNLICRRWHRDELPRAADERGDRWTALPVLLRAAPIGGFRELCIVGGAHYVRVGQAAAEQLRMFRILAADAAVTVINGEIGRMRQHLRGWLAAGAQLEEAA